MLRFITVRLVGGVVTLLLVTVLVFASTEVLPGDAARAILGQEATPTTVKQLRDRLGLDRPAVSRYISWLEHAVKLDFGDSIVQGTGLSGTGTVRGTPVTALISPRLGKTAILAAVTLAVLVPISLLVGIATGLYRESPADSATQILMLILISLPEFVLGAVLALLFGVAWPILPAVSFDASPRALVLPVATLTGVSIAYTSRFIRAGVSEVARTDYVAMAHMKGLSKRRIIRKHILPNALGPSLQAFALVIAYLAGGVVVVEYLFAYPGIGQGIVSAIASRDVPTIQAYTLLIAVVYVFANLGADLLTVLLNPRVRRARSR
jgi:peptide/nickel transport system permease protein